MADEWGPLAALAGDWAEEGGLDTAWPSRGTRSTNIGENTYLAENASTLSYDVTITIHDADSWSYDETTMLQMKEFDEPFAHTDHNTLRRVV